jgi:uncharacterized protein (UPF0548 family)
VYWWITAPGEADPTMMVMGAASHRRAGPPTRLARVRWWGQPPSAASIDRGGYAGTVQLLWRPQPADLADPLVRATGAQPTAGATGVLEDREPPPGLTRLDAVAELGTGRSVFARAGDALLRWDVHRAAGMVVAADAAAAAPGATVVNAGPFGPLAVLAPCRITRVVGEPARRGFVYASLPGHPLVGEEQFTVEIADERVRFRIRSFSRPVGLPGVVPALARLAQRTVNRRYLAAALRLAT